jgi:hypothetical protein
VASTNEQQDETAISPQGLCRVVPVTDFTGRVSRRDGRQWERPADRFQSKAKGAFAVAWASTASWWPCTCGLLFGAPLLLPDRRRLFYSPRVFFSFLQDRGQTFDDLI